MKKTLLLIAAISLFVSACNAVAPAAEESPALTGEDVQATALAMAWTMAAQTLAAMPTATFTPLPPTATFTPAFTSTPVSTPTPLFTSTPLPTATSSGGYSICNWKGEATSLLFVNDTKGEVGPISLYLVPDSNPLGYGDCYFVVPSLGKFGSTGISVPVKGTYFVFAYMSYGNTKKSVQASFWTNNPDKHEIHFSESGIKVMGP